MDLLENKSEVKTLNHRNFANMELCIQWKIIPQMQRMVVRNTLDRSFKIPSGLPYNQRDNPLLLKKLKFQVKYYE